jgi:hypothetical protein
MFGFRNEISLAEIDPKNLDPNNGIVWIEIYSNGPSIHLLETVEEVEIKDKIISPFSI